MHRSGQWIEFGCSRSGQSCRTDRPAARSFSTRAADRESTPPAAPSPGCRSAPSARAVAPRHQAGGGQERYRPDSLADHRHSAAGQGSGRRTRDVRLQVELAETAGGAPPGRELSVAPECDRRRSGAALGLLPATGRGGAGVQRTEERSGDPSAAITGTGTDTSHRHTDTLHGTGGGSGHPAPALAIEHAHPVASRGDC